MFTKVFDTSEGKGKDLKEKLGALDNDMRPCTIDDFKGNESFFKNNNANIFLCPNNLSLLQM